MYALPWFFFKKNYLRYYLEALEVFIYALSSEKMNVTLDFVILVEWEESLLIIIDIDNVWS